MQYTPLGAAALLTGIPCSLSRARHAQGREVSSRAMQFPTLTIANWSMGDTGPDLSPSISSVSSVSCKTKNKRDRLGITGITLH